MIKLSIFSDDLAANWERAVQVAQEAGLEGLDIRNVYGKSSKDLSDDEARSMARALKGTGLKVACMGSTYGRQFFLDDPASKQMTEDVLAKMIRFCEYFDTQLIRIFALWIPGYEEDRSLWSVRPRFSLKLLGRLVDAMATSVRMAESAGVKLLIENEGNSYSGTCREARLIMEAVDSPAVRCIYHPRPTGVTGESSYPEGYNQVRGFVEHVHMGRLDYMYSGEAPDVPHKTILESLKADGYDGWVTVERHFHPRDPEKMPDLRQQAVTDAKALRKLLDEVTSPAAVQGTSRAASGRAARRAGRGDAPTTCRGVGECQAMGRSGLRSSGSASGCLGASSSRRCPRPGWWQSRTSSRTRLARWPSASSVTGTPTTTASSSARTSTSSGCTRPVGCTATSPSRPPGRASTS